MSSISGAWQWNETPKKEIVYCNEQVQVYYKKTNVIKKAVALSVSYDGIADYPTISVVNTNGETDVLCDPLAGWQGSGYDDTSYLYFGEEEQEVSESFLLYISASAGGAKWAEIATWLAPSIWTWRNELTPATELLGYFNVTINGENRTPIFLSNEGYTCGAFSETGKAFYSSDIGWLDGNVLFEELTEETAVISDENRVWKIGGGYVTLAAYDYIYANAVKERDYLIKKTTLKAIADSIRSKTETESEILVSDMASVIGSIKTKPILQSKTIKPREYEQAVAFDSGYDGLSSVIVEAIKNQPTVVVTPSTSVQEITPANGYDGLERVRVLGVSTALEEYDGSVTIVNNVIEFTIERVSYKALNGMTWNEWISNTKYNTDGYYIGQNSYGTNLVLKDKGSGNTYYVMQTKADGGAKAVKPTDSIIEDEAYTVGLSVV